MLLRGINNMDFTWQTGIFNLTDSINEKSISATTIPVDALSENTQFEYEN